MLIDKQLLDDLCEKARGCERLRMNYDLRTSPDDGSQRMLNALEPGTKIPVHRHTQSTETVVVLRGRVRQNYYDEHGVIVKSFIVEAGGDVCGFSVPKGQWHNSEALENGTVIFEAKDGRYGEDGSETWDEWNERMKARVDTLIDMDLRSGSMEVMSDEYIRRATHCDK